MCRPWLVTPYTKGLKPRPVNRPLKKRSFVLAGLHIISPETCSFKDWLKIWLLVYAITANDLPFVGITCYSA